MTVKTESIGMTPDQIHAYLALADAIERARSAHRVVGCVEFPRLYDRHRQRGWDRSGRHTPEAEERRLRETMCGRCPAFTQCEAYRDSGVDQEGFLAVTAETPR